MEKSPIWMPFDATAKMWIERQYCRFTDKMGADFLLDVDVVLPTTDFFPDEYNCEPKDVLRVLRRLCKYQGVDFQRLKLKTFSANELGRLKRRQLAAEKDREHRYVWLQKEVLHRPPFLIGALARVLAKMRLLELRLAFPDAQSWEALADLMAVYLGVGILAANSVLVESNWSLGTAWGWQMAMQGSMTMDAFAYALALFAWYRGDRYAAWPNHLRGDVEAAYRKFYKDLDTNGDSLFRPIEHQGQRSAAEK